MRKVLVGIMSSGLLALAAIGAVPASAATANQKFVITETNHGETFVGIGPISGEGVDVTLTSTEDDDSFHETTRVDFAKGSVFITVNGENGPFSFNEETCVGRFSGKGTFQITGGTKAYKGVTGSGTFTVRGGFTGCDEDTGSFSSIVRARGKVSWS